MSSSKKALLEGAAAVGAAAVALASGPIGVLAAALPTIVSTGFDAIKAADRRRATRLIERMLEADESPATFAAHLNEKLRGDEDAIAAFRMLVSASIESVATAAIEPIALIGRRYLRGECAGWVARGWVRILSELTSNEIDQLRALVHGADALRRHSVAVYQGIVGTSDVPPWSPQVRWQIRRGDPGVRLVVEPMAGVRISHADLARIHGTQSGPSLISPATYANDYADRLFAELQRLHLARLDNSSALDQQERRQFERERKRDKAISRGEELRLQPLGSTLSTIEIVFDDWTFDVILEAMPDAPRVQTAGDESVDVHA